MPFLDSCLEVIEDGVAVEAVSASAVADCDVIIDEDADCGMRVVEGAEVAMVAAEPDVDASVGVGDEIEGRS